MNDFTPEPYTERDYSTTCPRCKQDWAGDKTLCLSCRIVVALPRGYRLVTTGVVVDSDLAFSVHDNVFEPVAWHNEGEPVGAFFAVARK